jgi:hypothetical protein
MFVCYLNQNAQLTKKKQDIITDERAIFEIRSYIDGIAQNSSLYQEEGFEQRIEAVDFIEFHMIDRLEELLQKTAYPHELMQLKSRAEKIKSELEEIDISLFQKLRADIRSGAYTAATFKSLISKYVDFNLGDNSEKIGYDNLDILINGLSPFQTIPEQTKELDPEMVYYQKTPARIIFELAKRVPFKENDVFFDLGSGMGQVAILVNLLTGINVKGVEFEPAFCNYARSCAADLNLPHVTFINADARKADYTEGTVFFMFTPFRGQIMEEVLAVLRKEALKRRIRIITYGPCTAQVALQNWLDMAVPKGDSMYKLGVFTSL